MLTYLQFIGRRLGLVRGSGDGAPTGSDGTALARHDAREAPSEEPDEQTDDTLPTLYFAESDL